MGRYDLKAVRLSRNPLPDSISLHQVALLLPTEKASPGLIITPDLVRDHIGFCNVPVKDITTLVTLGGLWGTIDE